MPRERLRCVTACVRLDSFSDELRGERRSREGGREGGRGGRGEQTVAGSPANQKVREGVWAWPGDRGGCRAEKFSASLSLLSCLLCVFTSLITIPSWAKHTMKSPDSDAGEAFIYRRRRRIHPRLRDVIAKSTEIRTVVLICICSSVWLLNVRPTRLPASSSSLNVSPVPFTSVVHDRFVVWNLVWSLDKLVSPQ